MRCTGCHEDKPEDEFGWKNRAAGKRHSYCRACKRRYNKTWYEKNAAKHKKDVARNHRRYTDERRAIALAAKSKPCTDCEIQYPPYVMDFDHVRGKKIMDIARMVSGRQHRTVQMLIDEIAKCEVVCANCHRIRTHSRLGLTDTMLTS